jgi:hypothetical protein
MVSTGFKWKAATNEVQLFQVWNGFTFETLLTEVSSVSKVFNSFDYEFDRFFYYY